MPCNNASHTHDWPQSGFLSISKCESKCGFCASSKDYKPASALRKHVLTHIKNHEMPLTLESSTGGRPTLRTTTNVPVGNDQPELPSPHSESPEVAAATSLPVENADVEGHTVRHIDNIFDFLRDTFATREVLYNEQVALIVQCIDSGNEAVDLLKSIGSGQRLVRQALDFLEIRLMEIISNDLFTWLEEPCKGYGWFWAQIELGYSAFLGAEDGGIQLLSSTIVQEVFYTTVILFVIRGILNDSRSTPEGPVPEVAEGKASTTGYAGPSHRPILLVLGGDSKKRLYDFFDDVYGVNFFADLQEMDHGALPPDSGFIVVANIVPKSEKAITLADDVERLHELTDRFESKWGLADSVLQNEGYWGTILDKLSRVE